MHNKLYPNLVTYNYHFILLPILWAKNLEMFGAHLGPTPKLKYEGIFTYMSGGLSGCWLEQECSHMASLFGHGLLTAWRPEGSKNSPMAAQGSKDECPHRTSQKLYIHFWPSLRMIPSPFHCIWLVTSKSQTHTVYGGRTQTPFLDRKSVKVTL